MRSFRNHIFGRLQAFKCSPDAAQTIVLENGGWNHFNEWMRAAIASKDVPLIMEILQVLETMPTTFSQLTGPGGKLTITVEKLLKNTVSRKSRDFLGEESEKLKVKCAEVFARWLRLKKKSSLGTTPPVKVGEELQLEIGAAKVIDEFPTPTTPVSDLESSSEYSGDTILFSDVFPTKRTTSSLLSAEQPELNGDKIIENDKPIFEQNEVKYEPPCKMAKMSPPENEETGEATFILDVNQPLKESEEISTILTSTPTEDVPSLAQWLEQLPKKRDLIDNISPIKKTASFDMEPPEKMVHWWPHNGVRSVYVYEANEDHERLGTVKEKWVSIIAFDSDIEDDKEEVPLKEISLEESFLDTGRSYLGLRFRGSF